MVSSFFAFIDGFSVGLVTLSGAFSSVPAFSGAADVGISGRNESRNLPGSISTSSFLAMRRALYDTEYFFRKVIDAATFRQCFVWWQQRGTEKRAVAFFRTFLAETLAVW